MSDLTVRCNPADVIKAIYDLNLAAFVKIQMLGFKDLLKMSIDRLESRELLVWLMEKIDPDEMVIRIGSGKTLPITPRAVNLVLGVPHGCGEDLPPYSHAEQVEATASLREQLGITQRSISIRRLLEEIQKKRSDELTIRCFFLILFNRLLLPTTSWDISGREVMASMDLERISRIDWCKVVFEGIRDAVRAWKGTKKSKTRSVFGCGVFLIIYYLDNLLHLETQDNAFLTPRAAYYDKVKMKSRESTCYAVASMSREETVASMSKEETLQEPADPMSLHIPLMRDMLAESLKKLTGHCHKEAVAAVEKYDTAMLVETQKILAIKSRLADEVRRLMDRVDVPSPPRHAVDIPTPSVRSSVVPDHDTTTAMTAPPK